MVFITLILYFPSRSLSGRVTYCTVNKEYFKYLEYLCGIVEIWALEKGNISDALHNLSLIKLGKLFDESELNQQKLNRMFESFIRGKCN